MKSEVADILQQMQGLLGRLAAALQEPGGEAPGTAASGMPAAATVAVAEEADARADRVYYGPSATYRVRDGVTLAVDGEKPHWITINATGATVLRGCTGENTVDELTTRLSQRHGVPFAAALADTIAFLETLEAIDYVQQSPRLAPPYGGRAAAVSLGQLAVVYLFVTNDCNLRCTHCYVSSARWRPTRSPG